MTNPVSDYGEPGGGGLTAGGPSVVALGGGHGLAVALRAARQYAGKVTAVASVADDGGSTGRLRRDYGVPAPGDLRKCIVALAADEDAVWPQSFEHRFVGGELGDHALGNLLIVGLTEVTGSFGRALALAGGLVGAVGQVLPATIHPVVLKADVEGERVEGQVAIQSSPGRIRSVELVPVDAEPPLEAVDAIATADQVVLAPGSLYTSLIPVLCVAALRDALVHAPGQVVQVCNLHAQVPETVDLDGVDHLRAVLEHGGRVDRFLFAKDGGLAANPAEVRALGAEFVAADLARSDGQGHDPAKLANALHALL